MATTTINKTSIAARTSRKNPPNTVIRQACDHDGRTLGYFTAAHNGTPAGMVAAANRASDAMFLAFDDVSNINSAIIATDGSGMPRWTISPNFRVIEEVGPAA